MAFDILSAKTLYTYMNATLFLVDGANVGRFSTLNGAPRKGSGKGKGKGKTWAF